MNGLVAKTTSCRKSSLKQVINESIRLLDSTVKNLKHHIHVKRIQFNFCNNVKNNLTRNEVLIHVDYSESYENKQQREIQSAYFGHTMFSKMNCETVTITSELYDHSRAAAITSVLTVINHLIEKPQHLPHKTNPIAWSNDCSAQFRFQFVFKLLSRIDSSLNITWCYNERYHGKGSINGIRGTFKNCVNRDVIPGKCVIDTPTQFAEDAHKTVKGITSL